MVWRMVIQLWLVLGLGMIIGLNTQTNTEFAHTVSTTSTVTLLADDCPIRTLADESILDVKRDETFPPLLEPAITVHEFEARTLEFLNAGGTPLRLQDLWRNQDAEISVREHDLDKNGNTELLITVRLQGFEYFGGIALLYCKESHYRFADWIMNGPYEYHPEIITIEDLDRNGKDEAVLTETWSGSSCEQQFWVVAWEGEQVQRLLNRANLVCPVELLVRDIDADGTKEIVLEGHRSSPQSSDGRRVTEIYALRGGRYELSSETPSAPMGRIHYMEDGYKALKDSDIAHATDLYEIAVFNHKFIVTPEQVRTLFANNPAVDDITEANKERYRQMTYMEGQNEWAFAHFRLLTLYYAQGEDEKGESVYQRMEKYFADDDYGYEFRKAAALFIAEWKDNQDNQRACKVANSLLWDYGKRPSKNNSVPRLSFRTAYLTYDWWLSQPDWCLIPTDPPPTMSTAPPAPLPSPLPPRRATNGTASTCIPADHADERLLYLDWEYIFTLIPETPAMSPEEFIDTALEFLNSGGTPLHLQDVWRSQGEVLEIQERDLDGDSLEELLFSIRLFGSDTGSGIGLFYCDQAQYHFGGWYYASDLYTEILSVEDLDQDGGVEMLLYATPLAGECRPGIRIVHWRERSYEDRLQSDGTNCIGIREYLIGDVDGDGLKEIHLQGHRLGGGERLVHTIYTFQDGYYRLFSFDLEAPTERVYLLEDANRLIEEGNITETITLYERAISDEALNHLSPYDVETYLPDDPDSLNANDEGWAINAYRLDQEEKALAMFRLVVLAYINNDPVSGQNWLDAMAGFPEASLANNLRRGAEQFTETFTATHNVGQACRSAEQVLNEQPLGASDEKNRAYFLENYAVSLLADGQGDWCPF